ncbi:MAG TPA: hypothetical protein VMF64_02720 [Steroidobacteraceae bacterium]|nr:hypothetical protein [Steroidobacteraceae bacterium]
MVKARRHSVWLAVAYAIGAALASHPSGAQSLLDGYWNPLFDEDVNERIPGPDQGDYAGLPVTAAAVSVAHTWDPERLTLPELQCRPHPSIYGTRAVGNLRIWEDRDPYTNAQTQIETWIMWMSQHRHIWMVPHPHPPPWARETWQGYSVGHWVGNVLHVHTDMVKAAWTRRNGLPTDDKATMDERFMRYGDILTDIMMISDPQYLSEPLVKSNEWFRAADGEMEPYPCSQVDEIPRAEGIVPMHLPGYNAMMDEYAVRNGVPIKASLGGAQTALPEYQDTMKKMPPNPPLSQIEKQEQQIIREEAAQ